MVVAPQCRTALRVGNANGIDPASVQSVPEFEAHARRTMPHVAFEYLDSGAADEHTVRWNVDAFSSIRLRTRVLQDVATVDTRVTLFGSELVFPILLAPVAYHRALHADGEIATVRGAGEAGATCIISTATTTSLEEIARVQSAPLWFQLYVQPDREVTSALVERAIAAGCQALCLTVDTPVQGARNRQARSGFALPAGVTLPYMTQINSGRSMNDSSRGFAVTWKDVEWLRSISSVPLILKGILTGDDAQRGIDHGADGIYVSNHGGRNLDTVPATIDTLPEVTARVGGRVPVIVDGGIRRGTDILKCLAHGATAVAIGRPYCYGLALCAATGVARVVEILRNELEMAMQFTGRRTIAEIDRSVLW